MDEPYDVVITSMINLRELNRLNSKHHPIIWERDPMDILEIISVSQAAS
jgi:hypothetical protein